MKMYVYSTLASDIAYTNHVSVGNPDPHPLPPVVIKGGAGVANDRLITPHGVRTEVTEEDVEYLRANSVFKRHEANGFVMISKDKQDPDLVASDMKSREPSSPLVDPDFKEDEKPILPEGKSNKKR